MTKPLSMKVSILIPFLIYIILLIIIGIYTRRSASTGIAGFFLGERKMNGFVIAISSVISARGLWLLLGITTQAYIMGFSAIWLIVGFIISEFLLFYFLAPLIRKYSEENNCLSLTDIFVSRLSDKKNSLRIIISMVLLFFLISFISSQLIGGSKSLYAFLGLSSTNGIIITGVMVLLITFFGGFKTLSYSDVLHAIIILTVLIGLPVIILIRRDGFNSIQTEILYSNPLFFSIKALSVGTLLGFLSLGLGSPGNAHILVKYMAIRVPVHFPRVAIFSALTNILLSSGALCIGIFARLYFPAADSIPGADPQNVYLGLADVVLSPVLLGIVLTSVFAAVMSATGAQILVSASTLTRDLYEKSFMSRRLVSQVNLVFFSRIAIVVLIYFSILMGLLIDINFSDFVLFAWAGLGASIGPAILLTFFWKGSTSSGIMAGVITGALTVIIWKLVPDLSEIIYELIPGFILALLAIWIGSLVDKKLISRRFNRTALYEDINKVGWQD